MQRVNKDLFKESVKIFALRVPKQACSKVTKALSRHLLDRPKLRTVVADPTGSENRLILLKEDVKKDDIPALVSSTSLDIDPSHVVTHEIDLDYDYFSADHVLRKLLPAEVDVPAGFEQIGHIAHLNLRDAQLPYKDVIGQVLLDKNPKLKTIVNKVGTISNEYRVFEMEVLAGDDKFEVEIKEHGCTFVFNFSEVYWNSRLQTEHQRLVKRFKQSDVICDMMAGVGPFAVPAAKRGCTVYANDLNPSSYSYLELNGKKNKVKKLHCYNMDGREFMRLMAKEGIKPNHVVMNLPATAIEFLDVFVGLYDGAQMPRIHCYCFSSETDYKEDILKRVEHVMGYRPTANVEVREVRDVAPTKLMYCISFDLTNEPLSNTPKRPRLSDSEDKNQEKQQKLETAA